MNLKKYFGPIYEQLYVVARQTKFNLRYRFQVMPMEDTVEYIKYTKCSIARFGDGEFGLITGSKKPKFQEQDEELARRLKEVCRSRNPRILICLPHTFKTTKDCNDFAKQFWDWWIWDNNNLEKAAKCMELSPWKTCVFGDAQITRPYMDWKDKRPAEKRFKQLKSLWENRDVIVVEGRMTKLGVGNDLLENAKSIKRIICPEKNAFSCYNEILFACRKYNHNKEALFLLALGPTATVLAYDLSINGYQALDIGHIDIEYEWYRRNAKMKIAIEGKYVQEIDECAYEEMIDEKYLSQIVSRIE